MDDRVRWEVRVGGYENGRAPSSLEAHRLARELRKRFGVGKVTVWRIRRVTWTRVTDDPATWPERQSNVLVTLAGEAESAYLESAAQGWYTPRGWTRLRNVTHWRPMPAPARVRR